MESKKSALLVGTREAARLLAISERTLWALAASGEIPTVRVGRRSVRYDPSDLMAYITNRKKKGGEA